MELFTHALDESLLDDIVATLDLDLVWQLLVDVILVFSDHEIGHLTSVENVVNILKE